MWTGADVVSPGSTSREQTLSRHGERAGTLVLRGSLLNSIDDEVGRVAGGLPAGRAQHVQI